ncbi:MAG: hypothetical protein IH620_08075 [Ignavibacterium sp.]|nr:hypothetical protein [Ignavibacterium sp.]
MKKLIVLLVLFIPFIIIAQDKVGNTSVKPDDQTMQMMTKISSDPDMRLMMFEMILNKTKNNEVEMGKLADLIMANAEMHKFMMASHPDKNETQIISVEPRGMKNENIKAGEMNKIAPVLKKQ